MPRFEILPCPRCLLDGGPAVWWWHRAVWAQLRPSCRVALPYLASASTTKGPYIASEQCRRQGHRSEMTGATETVMGEEAGSEPRFDPHLPRDKRPPAHTLARSHMGFEIEDPAPSLGSQPPARSGERHRHAMLGSICLI